jgi:hypothetical protein
MVQAAGMQEVASAQHHPEKQAYAQGAAKKREEGGQHRWRSDSTLASGEMNQARRTSGTSWPRHEQGALPVEGTRGITRPLLHMQDERSDTKMSPEYGLNMLEVAAVTICNP